MKINRISLALILTMFFVATVSAQDADQQTATSEPEIVAQETDVDDPATTENDAKTESEEAPEEIKQETQKKVDPEPEQPKVNPDASFTPTEEISEDSPVPFPVDI